MTLLMTVWRDLFINKEPGKENLRSVKTLKTLPDFCNFIILFLFTVSNLFITNVTIDNKVFNSYL